MSLEDLGNLGEALGGLAVLVTLVYLAIQTRENTKALRAATFQQVVDSFADISGSLSHDRELTEIVLKGRQDLASLDEVDQCGSPCS